MCLDAELVLANVLLVPVRSLPSMPPREGLPLLELAELPVRLAVSMDGRRLSFLLILLLLLLPPLGNAMVLCRRVKCSLPAAGLRKLSTDGERFDDGDDL